MKKGTKTAVYDADLHLEAYRFQGLAQPFPRHFHDCYVIGLVEQGARRMQCQTQTVLLGPGDIVLFNPGDSHACAQCDGGRLDYRSFNLPRDRMLDWTEEATGRRILPVFPQPVLRDEATAGSLRSLHELVLNGAPEFEKEEALFFLLSPLLRRCGEASPPDIPACRTEITAACRFLEQHYRERVSLAQICRRVGMSKSTLLRAFTQAKGITPYCYLENLRVSAAKRLLEQGVSPAEAALRTGFSDQSHLTNYFSRFTGLSPGAYRDMFPNAAGTEGSGHGA